MSLGVANFKPGRHFLRVVWCRDLTRGNVAYSRLCNSESQASHPPYSWRRLRLCHSRWRTMVRHIRLIAFAAALFGSLSAATAADKISQVFIRDAIQTNLAEIQLGQLAQDKAEGSGREVLRANAGK